MQGLLVFVLFTFFHCRLSLFCSLWSFRGHDLQFFVRISWCAGHGVVWTRFSWNPWGGHCQGVITDRLAFCRIIYWMTRWVFFVWWSGSSGWGCYASVSGGVSLGCTFSCWFIAVLLSVPLCKRVAVSFWGDVWSVRDASIIIACCREDFPGFFWELCFRISVCVHHLSQSLVPNSDWRGPFPYVGLFLGYQRIWRSKLYVFQAMMAF